MMMPQQQQYAKPAAAPTLSLAPKQRRSLRYSLQFHVPHAAVSALPYQMVQQPTLTLAPTLGSQEAHQNAPYVVCGYADKVIRVWNWRDGQQMSSGLAHTDRVNALACYWDATLERYLYFSAGDRRILTWYLDTGGKLIRHERALAGHNNHGVHCVITAQLSAHESPRVISSSNSDIRVWDFESTKRKPLLTLPMAHVTCMFSFERHLWIGFHDGIVSTYDLEQNSLLASVHVGDGAVTSLSRLEDGRVVVGTWDNRAAILGRAHGTCDVRSNCIAAPFLTCHEEHVLAAGHDGYVRLFDSHLQERQVVRAHQASASCIATLKTNTIISGGFDGGLNLFRLS
jgi:WD40 repeat protein